MKKTIDQLTEQDIGKTVSTEYWSGYLAHYLPRTTEASSFGLITTVNKGEFKRWAVQKNQEIDIDD